MIGGPNVQHNKCVLTAFGLDSVLLTESWILFKRSGIYYVRRNYRGPQLSSRDGLPTGYLRYRAEYKTFYVRRDGRCGRIESTESRFST